MRGPTTTSPGESCATSRGTAPRLPCAVAATNPERLRRAVLNRGVPDPTAAELRKELLDLFARIDAGPLTLETGLRASANIRAALDALQHELVGLARDEGASWS